MELTFSKKPYIEYENPDTQFVKGNSISLLLGAGFSIPMGYPSGRELNEIILNFNDDHIEFAPNGSLTTNINGEKPKFLSNDAKNQHSQEFEFCKRLIKLYNKVEGDFDYEKFYDFIKSPEAKDSYYQKGCDSVCGKFGYEFALSNVSYIYNQIVASLIHDKYGRSFYDGEPNSIEPVEGYGEFSKILAKWSESHIINVHTLNHDLLFESFRKSSLFTGKISDGFDEFGSNYFGELSTGSGTYHIRLERYTGRYYTPIRLFKLHGSLDYVLYRSDKTGSLKPDKYIKIKSGVGFEHIYKSSGSKMKYDRFPFAYHGDFLTGTTSKIKRYGEPFYKKLFKRFKNNLRNAEKLIIIGYGFKDSEINNIILGNFDYTNKPTFIIDPNPSKVVADFSNQINAKLIEESISNVSKTDFASFLSF